MARTLIGNGDVVCVDSARQVFPDGFVAIEGSDITAVGAAAQMPARQSFDQVIDATGCMVLRYRLTLNRCPLFGNLSRNYFRPWHEKRFSAAQWPDQTSWH